MRSVNIDPSRMGLAEFKRREWVATAPEGANKEDLLEPSFWSLMAAQMAPYDRIEVRADDGTWLAELLVLGCDRTWARTHLLTYYSLTTADVSLSQSTKYDVFWRGPHHKWSVKRLSDNEPVKTGCDTRDAALMWLREHERAVA